MNIALIGYGRMGHEIELAALQRGHNIKLIIDQDNTKDLNKGNLKGIDAAIEFSTPDAAFQNISKCLEEKIKVVSGTTGWLADYNKVVGICMMYNSAFIHSSNFSIGVNIIFKLNIELARQMDRYHNYKPSIEEIHHIKKLDAPSGTAITLAEDIANHHSDYEKWCFESEKTDKCIPINSIREGLISGNHTVTWDSDIDTISLKHETKNRKGLAFGAVIAAEYIQSRSGIFTMNDVMGF
jgi:4-hydroxy-tetrahydrodipicolinate reductase